MLKKTFNLLTKNQKQSLAIAIGLSIVIKLMPLTSYISQRYSLMFHELGHAVTAWCFGHFAVPRFDFINGGGVTDIYPRSFVFSVIIFIFVITHLIQMKNHSLDKRTKKLWAFFIVFSVVFFTPLHYSVITFMGKGGELLFCYFIGWYALSRLKLKLDVKAVIYLFLSVLLWINSVQDSVSLLFNEEQKAKYINGIDQLLGGSPLMNDLVKLSNSSGSSINFFNWLLLYLAIMTLYKTIKIANTPPLSKVRFYKYLQNLSNTIVKQAKIIKNKSSKNKDLRK